jgi:hypothetical protein
MHHAGQHHLLLIRLPFPLDSVGEVRPPGRDDMTIHGHVTAGDQGCPPRRGPKLKPDRKPIGGRPESNGHRQPTNQSEKPGGRPAAATKKRAPKAGPRGAPSPMQDTALTRFTPNHDRSLRRDATRGSCSPKQYNVVQSADLRERCHCGADRVCRLAFVYGVHPRPFSSPLESFKPRSIAPTTTACPFTSTL